MVEFNRLVVISISNRHSTRKAKSVLARTCGEFSWVYLGGDTSRANTLESVFQPCGKRLFISEPLQQTSLALRQPYIDYIGDLGKEVGFSEEWWRGSIAEKNPFVSNLFLNICYLKIALDLLETNENRKGMLFVTESEALCRNLAHSLRKHRQLEVYFFTSIIYKLRLFWLTARMLLGRMYFLANSLLGMMIVYLKTKANNATFVRECGDVDITIIRTWIDNRCFRRKNTFEDIYFRDLADQLQQRGASVVISPHKLVSLSEYGSLLQSMSNSSERFILPEHFLRVSDILNAVWRTLKPPKLPKKLPPFEGIDISGIILETQRQEWISNRAAKGLLFTEFLVQGWSRAGLRVKRVVWPFENHMWERLLCLAVRDYYSDAKLVGYQHSGLPLFELNYYFSSKERTEIPLPDRVVTNGSLPAKILSKSYYPTRVVETGGAIRYSSLLRKVYVPTLARGFTHRRIPTVLVAAPIDLNASVELIEKTIKALKGSKQYRLLIKCHPSMPFERVKKGLSTGIADDNIEISKDPISELLRISTVVLYSSTTVSVEAMAMGIPLIYVQSDYKLSLDPLGFVPHLRLNASTSEEIMACIRRITDEGETFINERSEEWQNTVRRIFGPVTDTTYELFLV